MCQAGQQLPDPATYRPANAAEASRLQEQCLHSEDPRRVAWAAELIAEDGRREQIAGLIAQINRLPSMNAKSPAAIPDAMLAVADALIQLHARVPADVVVKLPYGSTPQQLILLAGSPDGRDPLMRIFERTAVPLEWLAAANLIAEAPTADFARSLLNDFKDDPERRHLRHSTEVCAGPSAATVAHPAHGAGSALPGSLAIKNRLACPAMRCLLHVCRPLFLPPPPSHPLSCCPPGWKCI